MKVVGSCDSPFTSCNSAQILHLTQKYISDASNGNTHSSSNHPAAALAIDTAYREGMISHVASASSASSGSQLTLARSSGTDPTASTLSPVSDGTSLGAVEFDGFGTTGSGAVRASAARIEGVVHDGGTISNTALGGKLLSRRRARMEILRHSVSALTMRAKLLLILQARLPVCSQCRAQQLPRRHCL